MKVQSNISAVDKKNIQAFTLIELAIVLAIIGLIISGVFAGRNLINAARMHALINDFTSQKIAMDQFKAQYGGLAGDFSEATSFWGTSANGNGDGSISWTDEGFLTWQHLTLSGVYPGTYTGTSSSSVPVPGHNVPEGPHPARTGNSGRNACYLPISGAGSVFHTFGPESYNYIQYGSTQSGWPCILPILNPLESYQLDIKADDGMPYYGQVRTRIDANDCLNGTAYDITDSAVNCAPIFIINRI